MKQSNFVEAHKIKTHFVRFGSGAQKLVILHGWATEYVPRESFTALAQELAKELKYEIIIPDLPGFGDSGFPPKSGWHTTDYADWLADFLKQLEIKNCVLYGHSFGCRVIVRFLLKHPEFSGKVILTGAAGIRWPLSLRQKLSQSLSKVFSGAKNLLPKKIQKIIVTKLLGAHDWGVVPENLKETLRKTLEEPDFRNELPKIKNQVLLLWGKNDGVTPIRSGRVFANKLPHAEFQVVPNARHGLHKTDPEKIVAAVTKFLSEKE